MRSTEAPTIGFTNKLKNPTTRPMRQKAITSMIKSCLAKTDRCTAGRGQASLIAATDEPVADAPHGLDEGGMAGIVAELLAEPGDEHVDRAVVGLPVEAARGLQDAVAGEDAPAVPHEEREQLELGGGELEGAALEPRRARVPLDLERPHLHRLARLRAGPAAQNRLEACHQLARFERLGQVVVGPQLEPDDAVHDAAAGGEHDDGHAARLPHL